MLVDANVGDLAYFRHSKRLTPTCEVLYPSVNVRPIEFNRHVLYIILYELIFSIIILDFTGVKCALPDFICTVEFGSEAKLSVTWHIHFLQTFRETFMKMKGSVTVMILVHILCGLYQLYVASKKRLTRTHLLPLLS